MKYHNRCSWFSMVTRMGNFVTEVIVKISHLQKIQLLPQTPDFTCKSMHFSWDIFQSLDWVFIYVLIYVRIYYFQEYIAAAVVCQIVWECIYFPNFYLLEKMCYMRIRIYYLICVQSTKQRYNNLLPYLRTKY